VPEDWQGFGVKGVGMSRMRGTAAAAIARTRAPERSRNRTGARLLTGVSALALLLGTPMVLVPMPALAACILTPPNTFTCNTDDPNPDTNGVSGADLTVTVDAGATISMTGDSHHGIEVDGTNTITIDGTVEVSGSSAKGVVADGDSNTITVSAGGKIDLNGPNEIGIQVTGDDNTITVAGDIDATMPSSMGIWTEGSGNTITVSGVIDSNSFGIEIYKGTGNTVNVIGGAISTDSSAVAGIIVRNGAQADIHLSAGASILAKWAQGGGIKGSGAGNIVEIDAGTEIVAEAAAPGGYGVSLSDGGNSVTLNGRIESNGNSDYSYGVEFSTIDATNPDRDKITIGTTGSIKMAAGTGIHTGNSIKGVDIVVAGTIESATGDAIRLEAGTANTLELHEGYAITGNVVARVSGSDIFALGGDSNATFDVAKIGAQFQNFSSFKKTGTSAWTLTGTNDTLNPTAAWEVAAGTLLIDASMRNTGFSVRSGATLGGNGTIEYMGVLSGATLAPGGIGVGDRVGTLTIAEELTLYPGSILNFDLGLSGSDRIKVERDLTAYGFTLNVADAGDFGTGVYTLIEYDRLWLNPDVIYGTNPDNDLTYVVSTTSGTSAGPGAVILTVSGGAGGSIQYWDTNPASGAQGGTGIWDNTTANWLADGGSTNEVWGDHFAVFDGTPGTVTVAGAQDFTGLQFLKNYTVQAGTGGVLNIAGSGATIRVADLTIATLDIGITGGSITKADPGRLILKNNDYAPIIVQGGTLELQNSNVDGGAVGVVMNASIPDAWVIVDKDSRIGGSSYALDASGSTQGVSVELSGKMDGDVRLSGSPDVFLLTTEATQLPGHIDGGGGTDRLRFHADPGKSATFTLGGSTTLSSFERGEMVGAGTWTINGGTGSIVSSSFEVDSGTLIYNVTSPGLAMDITNYGRLAGTGTLGAVRVRPGDNTAISPGNGGSGAGGGVGTVGTLSFASLVLREGVALDFDLGLAGDAYIGSTYNDLIRVTGDLTLETDQYADTVNVNVNGLAGFGNGDYTLITYGGALHNDDDVTFTVVGKPDPSLDYQVHTTAASNGAVVLSVTGGAAGDSQYWDGPNAATTGVQGGTGDWNGSNDNWTNVDGTANGVWGEQFAIFGGTGGTVTVQGEQTFTGMQFKAGGYSLGAADSNAKLVAGIDETRIVVDPGLSASISARIDVAADKALVKAGTGRLGLGGANTYSGATLVNAGTLSAITDNSFSANSAHTVAAGAVLALVNADDQSSDQTIGSLAGAGTVLLGTATLTTGGDDTSTIFSGRIEGDGGLVKTGTGTLTLTGENTYAGPTLVADGTLSLGNGGTGGAVAGDIENNANLVFNRANSFVYDGALSGNGTTSFIGAGTTTFTGDSSGFMGDLSVTAGTLRVGEDASARLRGATLNVGAGGTLSGLGTIITDSVNVAGRLAPGGETALGKLTIDRDLMFEDGSIYAVRIAGTNPNATPSTDSVTVIGTATLSGIVEVATIDPRANYVDGHAYTILTALEGYGTTEFDGAVMASGSSFITPTLSYLGGDVLLTIAVTQDFSTAAETYNQLQAAGALNGLAPAGDALTVFNAIANMNDDDARAAFDQSSGEIHAASQRVIAETFALFSRTLRAEGVAGVGAGNVGAGTFAAPLGYGPAPGNAGTSAIDGVTDLAEASGRGVWIAPLGGVGHSAGDGNAAPLDWWNAGLAGGYEAAIDMASGTALGGVGLGYIRSQGVVEDRASSFDGNGVYVGAYGAWSDGPASLAGSLAYGAAHIATTRDIAFMGRTAEAEYWAHTIGLSGEASYAFALADTTRIAPLFTLDASWSGHGGFTETGAGALNVTAGPEGWAQLDMGLGVALTHSIVTDGGLVTLEGRAVWEHAFADAAPSQALTLAGSPAGFDVRGPAASRDRLRVGAGLSWEVSDDMTVRARYDGLFSADQAAHAASFGLNVRF